MMLIESANHEVKGTDYMYSKVIVLWGDDSLLLKAVESLLDTEDGFRVIRLSERLNNDLLIHRVKEACPDIFIIHEELIVEKMHLVTKFLQDLPKMKIITINFENNQVEVYNKQTICIKKSSDLLSIIEGDVEFDTKVKGGAINH